MQAAIAHLEGRKADFDAVVAKALAINPRYGDIYRVPGANSASHYRFEEAVALVQKAIEIEPDSARAQGDLGLHLLRTGDEASARTALEKAFKLDGYDVVTYNLLEMLDTLDKFETIKDGDLIVRLHPDEVRVMKEPMLRLAHEALAALSKRSGFTPTGPILIEAFPKHDDFAVRTLGLPGMMGALGVCFGKVVTLDSPRARQPPGDFNWSETLWHELAHVITLQMSNQRVPRWLTEGISVFEERRARPEWGRDGEFEFLNAMAKGELIKVAELNSGFMSIRTINLAYHQSSVRRRAHRRSVRRRSGARQDVEGVRRGARHRSGGAARAGHRSRGPAALVRSVPRSEVRKDPDRAETSRRRQAAGRCRCRGRQSLCGSV